MTTNRVLFLDIDGPLIPGRAYDMAGQTRPFVTKFDPVAVSIINTACGKTGRKIVIHSSWIRTKFIEREDLAGKDVLDHCIAEGIIDWHFHPDVYCNRDEPWRYNRIQQWLDAHPEVDDFVILDDEPCSSEHLEKLGKHLLLVDFEDGLLMKHWRKLLDGNWKNP